MHNNRPKIVAIEGGKGQEKEMITIGNDEAVLIINGQVVKLSSFIISGDTQDTKNPDRVLMTYNCSTDTAAGYLKHLDVAISDQIRKKYVSSNKK
ncbi:hypothetical protein [Bacillus toyonensis]|uniref:hypothetical protein n=1 Tax=Bacillus toyonensis TaxID=155322 RepID=UPI002E1E422E|nr:hypothetical protein [Bacillus toyonensis]